jgi:hypothetical protein
MLMLGAAGVPPVHAQVVTLDQSIADTFYGCGTGTYCQSTAEISSNPNRYVLVFMNMRGAGPGTWGIFSAICLAASGSTCESGNYLTLTKEGVEPNPRLDTQLMIADAYTTTGFTNYMLRYEYSTVGYDLDEFGFDASTWANTATTSPFFEDLNSCNATLGAGSANAVCNVASGTSGRVVVAAFSLDADSCYEPGATFYQTEVTYTANYACSVSPLDVHGVEYTQTSSSVNMEFGLSSTETPALYIAWAMIALGILPGPSVTTTASTATSSTTTATSTSVSTTGTFISSITTTSTVTTTAQTTVTATTTATSFPVTMTVSYSVVGGGSPTAPVFHYVLNGVSKSLTLTKTPAAVSVDGGSAWSVTPNPLGGSTSSERWFSTQPLTGTASATTIVFVFQNQYLLTMNANGPGSVTPSSGWYNAGVKVTLTATANTGHKFLAWKGTGTGSYTGSNNPATITMNSVITETANFT